MQTTRPSFNAASESIRTSSSFPLTRICQYQHTKSKSNDFSTCRETRRRRGIGCVGRRFGRGIGGSCVVFEEPGTFVSGMYCFFDVDMERVDLIYVRPMMQLARMAEKVRLFLGCADCYN